MHEDLCDSFENEIDGNQQPPLDTATDQELRVKLSRPLLRKLRDTARDEGIDLAALVAELLAEGVTLRAWEIIERKGAMRGHNSGGMPPGQGNPRYGQRHPGNERHGHHRGGPNDQRHGNSRYGQPQGNRRQGGQPPNNAWMEDKAAFLEYVRNQEKQRRR